VTFGWEKKEKGIHFFFFSSTNQKLSIDSKTPSSLLFWLVFLPHINALAFCVFFLFFWLFVLRNFSFQTTFPFLTWNLMKR